MVFKAIGKKIAPIGGRARAESLSPERRSEIARNAGNARWKKRDATARAKKVA